MTKITQQLRQNNLNQKPKRHDYKYRQKQFPVCRVNDWSFVCCNLFVFLFKYFYFSVLTCRGLKTRRLRRAEREREREKIPRVRCALTRRGCAFVYVVFCILYSLFTTKRHLAYTYNLNTQTGLLRKSKMVYKREQCTHRVIWHSPGFEIEPGCSVLKLSKDRTELFSARQLQS